MTTPISGDDTHIAHVANPSGAKKASGDSSAGVDAATLKAVAENLVINGMIDLSAIQMIERSTLSHLNDNKITAVGGMQRSEKRSEKINELALGMDASKFESSKIDSLGDIMCELMVLMIQSTSERRQIERELSSVLSVAQVEQSNQIAEAMREKMEIDVGRIKISAWTQFAVSMAGTAISIGGAAIQGAKMANSPGTMSATGITKQLQQENEIKKLLSTASEIGTAFADLDDIKASSQLEESIQRKRTALKLTRSVASSVETSLRSIDSIREQFMSIMEQVNQMLHDGAMKIIRNTVI
jgi:hypothetical protein